MVDLILWEAPADRELLRLYVSQWKGRTKLDLRRFYQKDGDWRHGNKGIPIPLEHVAAIGAALTAWANANMPDGPENASGRT